MLLLLWGYMAQLGLLLVSSLMTDDGVLRSSFSGLPRLAHGLDAVCGSRDRSSDSMDPVHGGKSKGYISDEWISSFLLFSCDRDPKYILL